MRLILTLQVVDAIDTNSFRLLMELLMVLSLTVRLNSAA